MHAVVLLLASALRVFFFGTQLGRNICVHYLAAHRTATHRRVRSSMVVVWASLNVGRHFIVRPLTFASLLTIPRSQKIRWSEKLRLPFRSYDRQKWPRTALPLRRPSSLLVRLLVQLGVGGLKDLAHAPLTDEGGHVVVAEGSRLVGP